MKKQTFDHLHELAQDVVQIIGSSKASQKLKTDMEDLAQKWDELVHLLEDYTNQVSHLKYVFSSLTNASGLLQL